jgi:hypothetical protein
MIVLVHVEQQKICRAVRGHRGGARRGHQRSQVDTFGEAGHDLNKNTLHSLALSRLTKIADLGLPLLAAVSNKDFVGEATGWPRRTGRRRRSRSAPSPALASCGCMTFPRPPPRPG